MKKNVFIATALMALSVSAQAGLGDIIKEIGKKVGEEIGDSRGCYHRSETRYKAQELESSSIQLRHVLNTIAGYSELAEEARELAREARQFADLSETGELCWRLDEKFEEVVDEFQELRQAVEDDYWLSHYPPVRVKYLQVRRDFRDLREIFRP